MVKHVDAGAPVEYASTETKSQNYILCNILKSVNGILSSRSEHSKLSMLYIIFQLLCDYDLDKVVTKTITVEKTTLQNGEEKVLKLTEPC